MYEDLKTCPICCEALNRISEVLPGSGRTRCACANCGTYEISDMVDLNLLLGQDAVKRAVLSNKVRQMTLREPPFLSSNLVPRILEIPLPTASEQCNNLLLWLSTELPVPGNRVWVSGRTHRAVAGAASVDGFDFIMEYLSKRDLIDVADLTRMPGATRCRVMLSLDGWEYIEKLRRENPSSRIAFMALKFGDPDLDHMVSTVFKPAVEQTGFELRVLSDRPRAGLIDDRLRVEIRNSRFLVADLTHENAGAYWEAGFAEGLGRPVIYTCEQTKFDRDGTHFDTNHHLTIIWDKDNPQKATDELKATIRATLPTEARMSD